LVDPRDNHAYATVAIGSQCWMAENLDHGTMIPAASWQTNNSQAEKWCYGDVLSNCGSYGGLYQWDEMMDYSPSDGGNPSTTQGICPVGWHVPSDEEWKTLEMQLGMSQALADLIDAWRGAPAGTALKVGGTSGYDALLSGRCVGGACGLLSQYEFMHSATEYTSVYAWRRCLQLADAGVGRFKTFPKSWGLSVRCVLD
jgi:uncharacterized protein (TIGR02145 family)